MLNHQSPRQASKIATTAPLGLLVGACALFGWQAYHSMRACLFTLVDDAYISLRYAWQWVNGAGIVWQPGDRVEGYTNFLQVALLALGMRLGVDGEIAAYIIGWTTGLASIVVAFLLARAVSAAAGLWAGGVAALLLGASPHFAFWSVSGLETPLFLLLCLTSLWLLACTLIAPDSIARALLLGGALAGAAMTRPDGLLLTGAVTTTMGLALWRASARRRSIARALVAALAVFSVIYGGYFLWRLTYYGQLWPNTFYAKVGSGPEQIKRGASYAWSQLQITGGFPLVLGAILSFAPLSRRHGDAERYRATLRLTTRAAMAGFGLMYLAYLIYIGGDHFGARMALSVIVMLTILSAAAIVEFAAALRSANAPASIPALLVVLFCGMTLYFTDPARTNYWSFSPTQRSWKRLGLWLRENAPAQSLIAVDVAGAVPYFSQLRSIDMFGLNDAHIAHLDMPEMGKGEPGHEKYDPAYVYSRNPDYIFVYMNENGAPALGLDRWPERERYSLYMVIQTYGEPTEAWYRLVEPDSDIRALWREGYRQGLWKRNDRLLPTISEVDLAAMHKEGAWEKRWIRGSYYLKATAPGSSLTFDVESGTTLAIVTVCHHWSGMIEVRIADALYRVDLYKTKDLATFQCVHRFDVPDLATERIPASIKILPEKNPMSNAAELFVQRVLLLKPGPK